MRKYFHILFLGLFLVLGFEARGGQVAVGSQQWRNNFQLSTFNFQFSNTYAADGRKLATVAINEQLQYTEGTKTYNGNLVFDVNGDLEYILFDEGRILYNPLTTEFTFEYHLKDHLGSPRVLFTPTTTGAEVVQEIAYYPGGAPIAALSYLPLTSTNRYFREGKEYISDHDWNKYDYHWRAFCSWSWRSLQIDPMAEMYPWISPYAIFANNPLKYTDPTGMYFDETNNKKAVKIEKKLDKQIAKVGKSIAKTEKKGGDASDQKARVGQMQQSKTDIADMRSNESTEFRYAKVSDKNNPAGKGNPTIDGLGTNVVTMYVDDVGTQLHESRHGGDIARGTLTKDNYNVEHEVSAYKAQYSYSGEYNYIHKNVLNDPILDQAYQLMGIGALPLVQINNISLINAAMVNNIGQPYQFNLRDGKIRKSIRPLYPPLGIPPGRWNNQ